ncbi:MAG: zinc-dependent alcohol dehydrogenase [Christensenellales bacterium]|jgi:L-iditol 2-dehydrogenase
MEKMKAVVLRAPDQYAIEFTDIPKAGDNEVLVRIKAVSICGSDPKLFKGQYLNMGWPPKYPFILGHEFSGEVVALGNGVTAFQIGDRVAGEAHCGCGTCPNCKAGHYNLCLNYGKTESGHRHYGFNWQGAYAEYNAYSVNVLTKIPDNLSFDEATLADTGGTALHAVRLSGITVGGYTLIIGPGPIGIFAMQVAKAMGGKTIMVGRRERLAAAQRLGADYAIDYEKVSDIVAAVKEITGGMGADEVFECAGSEVSVSQAVKCARKNGKVVIVSFPVIDDMKIPVKTVVNNQITILGSKANPNCAAQIMGLMATRVINTKVLITHKFPIEQIKEAMDTFTGRKDGALKVVINP